MRRTWLAIPILLAAAACAPDNDPDPDPMPSIETSAVPRSASLCGSAAVASIDRNRLEIASFEDGDLTPVKLELPADAKAEPDRSWRAAVHCASTDDGPIAVVTYGWATEGAVGFGEDAVVGMFGLELDGTTAWYHELRRSQTVRTVADAVMLTDDPAMSDKEPRTTVLDAATGQVVVDKQRLPQATPIDTDRMAYGTDEPVLATTANEPIAEPDTSGLSWVAGGGVAVLTGEHEITAYDAESGDELWSVPAEGQSGLSGEVDTDAGVLLTTTTLLGPDTPAIEGEESDTTLSGIDLETGEILWSREFGDSYVSGDKHADGGMFGVGIDHYESRTGDPLTLPDKPFVIPFDAGPHGLLVLDNGAYRVLSLDELRG